MYSILLIAVLTANPDARTPVYTFTLRGSAELQVFDNPKEFVIKDGAKSAIKSRTEFRDDDKLFQQYDAEIKNLADTINLFNGGESVENKPNAKTVADINNAPARPAIKQREPEVQNLVCVFDAWNSDDICRPGTGGTQLDGDRGGGGGPWGPPWNGDSTGMGTPNDTPAGTCGAWDENVVTAEGVGVSRAQCCGVARQKLNRQCNASSSTRNGCCTYMECDVACVQDDMLCYCTMTGTAPKR